MSRRFLVAYLAFIACAAFAPAASASPVLTEEGFKVAPGTTVTAQSEGTIYRTDAVSNRMCQNSDMHGTLVKNTGSLIEIEFSSVSFTGKLGGACEGIGADSLKAGNLPWCLRIGTEPVDSFTLSGGKCGEAPKSITLTVGSGCSYVATNGSLSGTYNTNTLGGELTTDEEYFSVESGSLCRPFILDPIKYNLSTAASPLTRLTIS